MSILVTRYCGFCSGVDAAVTNARQYAPQNAYMLGRLTHNEYVMKSLMQAGLCLVSSADDIPTDKIVLLRAHGEKQSVIDALTERGLQIVDCTCPCVAHIHRIVTRAVSNGARIVILGDELHPEVQAIADRAGEHCIVTMDGANVPYDDKHRYIVVFQTTFPVEKSVNALEIIKSKLKSVEIFNTICYTTQCRQKEATFISQSSDTVIVIGDKGSANTRKLFDIAKTHAKEAYLISELDEVPQLTENTKYGIIAGASTPKELIQEVISFMSETLDTTVSTVEEAAVPAVEETAPVAEAVAVPVAEVAEPAAPAVPETFTEMLNNSAELKIFPGRTYKCKVVSADEKGIIVGIGRVNIGADGTENFVSGCKKDGFIDCSDACASEETYNPADFAVGSIIEATVIENKNPGFINLSKKSIDEIRRQEEALNAGEFTMKVEAVAKKKDGTTASGLTGKVGRVEIFVPASQIKLGFVKEDELEKYVGKELRLRLIDTDREGKINRRRRIASQKVILIEEREAREETKWQGIVAGSIVTGKVKRFYKDSAAFVSVNGLDCMIHISEMSWNHISSPAEVFTIDESYDFVIISCDREHNRVSLSYKQLQESPYEAFASQYPVGSVVRGTVARIEQFRAFIQIAPGVDGMVHVSEISHSFTPDARNVLKEGEEIDVKVTGIDVKARRITLSIKQLTAAPEADENGERKERAKKPERKGRDGKPFKHEEPEVKEYVEGSSTSNPMEALLSQFNIEPKDED